MRKSVGIVVVALILVSGMSTAIAAQSPESSDDQLFIADGIDAPIIAQADTEGTSITSGTLLLELIELAPDTEMAPHDTTSPELFSVLSGVLVFRDNFGFASLAEADSTVSLNPGTQYTIANQESEPGRLLRLRIAGGEESGPAATPVADEGGPTVLVQIPLQDLQLESGRIYLARVQFGAGANSGEQGHAGPIGLYIESGAINVVSPSGLVGTIGEGQAVSLPAETPLIASTGETEAVAYIAGVSGPEGAVFERLASADGLTAEGSVLDLEETWRTKSAEMSVELRQYSQMTGFHFDYVNISDAATPLAFDRNSASLTDDSGREWNFVRTTCSDSATATPQESVSCSAHFSPPTGTSRGPMVLTFSIEEFGDVRNATWQVEIDW